MPAIFLQCLILGWVALSIFSIGLALGYRCFAWRGNDLLGYGVALGVAGHALAGVLIVCAWPARNAVAFLLPLCAIAALIYLWKGRVLSELVSALKPALRVALGLWISFVILCLALTHVNVTWPENLPDGLYIFKQHRTPVKLQLLSNLPADNYIPYQVAEYFVRKISFQKERPLLPGQEVSNRTILMSLVAVPFRTALSWKTKPGKNLGRFTYIGRAWPNAEHLNDDNSFEQFLPIGIFLNSLLLFGLIIFFADFEPARSLIPATILFATNPFCLLQTFFTWPKALAGFFLLLAWQAVRRGRDPKLVGVCAALAYHAHPAAGAALVCIGFWYVWRAWRFREEGWRPMIEFGVAAFVLILPWIVWTQLVLGIPNNLIAQNLMGDGTEMARASLANFLWIRCHNALVSFTPFFFAVYPFRSADIAEYAMRSLPTAVGLIIFSFAIAECLRRSRSEPFLIWFGLIFPFLLVLAVFSLPSTPLYHGAQVTVGVLIFFAALRMREMFSPRIFGLLFALQIAGNLALLALRAALAGTHL